MDFDFIQIGAGVGNTNNDPVYQKVKNGEFLNGLLIEANPICIGHLKNNYSFTDKVHFENVAISEFEGETVLYIDNWINDTSGKGAGTSQLATIKKGQYPENTELLEIRVKCTTLHGIWNKYSINHSKWLFVDAEGKDFDILINTDFSKINIDNIHFEHFHMSDFDKLNNYLNTFNYFLINKNEEDAVFKRR